MRFKKIVTTHNKKQKNEYVFIPDEVVSGT